MRFLFAILLSSTLFAADPISVAFPAERAVLPPITNTYLIGAIEGATNGTVSINDSQVDIYHTGAFLAMVSVTAGVNKVEISWNGNSLLRSFKVEKPRQATTPPKPSKPHDPCKDLNLPPGTTAKEPPKHKSPGEILVVVDAGHGGSDSGAVSPHGKKEKDVNLLVAKALEKKLAAAGFKVLMTRSDDSFPALYDRPKFACRKNADLFVSIHHNATAANRNPREARHVVTYASNDAGLALAAAIQKHLAPTLAPIRDAGAQTASYAVCRNPLVPSCLVEVDFINLPEGEEESWDTARHVRTATAITLGILDWIR